MKKQKTRVTQELCRKVQIVLALIALMVLSICGVFDEPEWKPVAEYPLVNQKISWNSCLSLGNK